MALTNSMRLLPRDDGVATGYLHDVSNAGQRQVHAPHPASHANLTHDHHLLSMNLAAPQAVSDRVLRNAICRHILHSIAASEAGLLHVCSQKGLLPRFQLG